MLVVVAHPTRRLGWQLAAALAVCSAGCNAEPQTTSSADSATPSATPSTAPSLPLMSAHARPAGEPTAVTATPGSDATPRTNAADDDPPLELRRAGRGSMVYAQPDFGAPFRGKIPSREIFAVYERVDGGDDRCEAPGWARVGASAYACLDQSEITKRQPHTLPVLPDEMLVPYFYARLYKKGKEGTQPPAPVWRTRGSIRDRLPPISKLEPAHVYAFDKRKRTRDGILLYAKGLGVVKEADVKRLEPSDFAGRDLDRDPIPPGLTPGWSVVWQYVPVFAEPRPGAPEIGRIEYQAPLYVVGPPRRRGGTQYRQVVSPVVGWVEAKQVRIWIPMEPPPQVRPDQVWLDVELDQQTLTVVRGDRPEFLTMVSTGSYKDPTPPGLFRIITKEAFGDMRSRDEDEDEYHVEAVPWVQYFYKRYGFHGTYWHNRFGRRTSHGCVNLSARDARRVFELTSPQLPAGWMTVYEHPDELGTLVRIRKGTEVPPDRRAPPRERRISDYD